MTDKTKAVGDGLVEKFYHKIHNTHLADWLIMQKATQCAIIAVEEIINHMTQDDLEHEDCHNANSKWMVYWYGVLNYLKSKQ